MAVRRPSSGFQHLITPINPINRAPCALSLMPYTPHPVPRNPQLATRNPQPATRNTQHATSGKKIRVAKISPINSINAIILIIPLIILEISTKSKFGAANKFDSEPVF